ncbi:MAG TPA: substrate-binding domain-containing protein, partial [Aggregatilineales bacterium]|nr:substrate-binding domain-containing protein [Aggregatilineales bacterium]
YVLRPQGYEMLLASTHDLESEMLAIEAFRTHQVAGIIFMSLSVHYPVEHLLQLKEEGVPFVVINRDLDDDRFNRVELDDHGAAYAATEHLIGLGHAAIGTVSGPLGGVLGLRRRSAIERHAGWQAAMLQHGLLVNPTWIVSGSYTYEGGYHGMQRLLASLEGTTLPSALFVASDVMAVGALKAIYEAELRVPDDIAIITVGDPPFAAYTIPALTTMSIPIVEAGRVAARMLLERIDARKPVQPERVRLNFSLEVRESCGARPRSD